MRWPRNGSGAGPVLRASVEDVFMGDRRVETALRDIDALFRIGVVSGMSDGQLLERFSGAIWL